MPISPCSPLQSEYGMQHINYKGPLLPSLSTLSHCMIHCLARTHVVQTRIHPAMQ